MVRGDRREVFFLAECFERANDENASYENPVTMSNKNDAPATTSDAFTGSGTPEVACETRSRPSPT